VAEFNDWRNIMTLWRIEDGIPSVADGLLVAGGMISGIGLFVYLADPVLNYFELRGMLYLGFAVLFLIFGSLGALGFLVFFRNQNKMRDEIRIPRLVFALSTPPLFLLFHALLIAWLFPAIIRKEIMLDDAYQVVGLSLIVVFAVMYAIVVRAALRWPARTTAIALWFNVGLGAAGVTAKVLSLFFKK
jgi:hypothetical protein